jgi:uncharacterized membrane protein YozB (DUF420 family)
MIVRSGVLLYTHVQAAVVAVVQVVPTGQQLRQYNDAVL